MGGRIDKRLLAPAMRSNLVAFFCCSWGNWQVTEMMTTLAIVWWCSSRPHFSVIHSYLSSITLASCISIVKYLLLMVGCIRWSDQSPQGKRAGLVAAAAAAYLSLTSSAASVVCFGIGEDFSAFAVHKEKICCIETDIETIRDLGNSCIHMKASQLWKSGSTFRGEVQISYRENQKNSIYTFTALSFPWMSHIIVTRSYISEISN